MSLILAQSMVALFFIQMYISMSNTIRNRLFSSHINILFSFLQKKAVERVHNEKNILNSSEYIYVCVCVLCWFFQQKLNSEDIYIIRLRSMSPLTRCNNIYQIQPGKRSYLAPTLVHLNISLSHIGGSGCKMLKTKD